MVIIIYSKNEVQKLKQDSNVKTITETCPKINDACPEKELETLNQTTPKEQANNNKIQTNDKISINKGTLEELQTLPGIGESKAKTIIKYRSENGSFKSIEDIKNVNGIGTTLYEKIKDKITT